MVLDPISAIGLAGNVIQFVDFTTNLVGKSYQLYHSANGSLVQNLELQAIASNLTGLVGQLSKSARDSAAPAEANHDKPTQSDETVIQIAQSCENAARDVLEALEQIQVNGAHRKWNSFRQALRSIWSQDKIEALLKRLSECRNALSFHLVVSLSENQAKISRTLKDLEYQGKQVHQNMLTARRQIQLSILKNSQHMQDMLYAFENQQWSGDPENNAQSMLIMLTNMANDDRISTMEQRLLYTLHFSRTRERRQRIKEAYEGTFQRVLDDSNLGWWMRNQSGLYWIGGKAGSGKSTLMKFLQTDPKTTEYLRRWAGNESLVKAGFYFWNAGTQMQKSQIGLLQSLLFEIIRQSPNLIPTVFPMRWQGYLIFGADFHPWTYEELSEAFELLACSELTSTKFCFFIDGLDEYEGHSADLLQVLNDLMKVPNVKICASSRPWNAFRDAFLACPSLMLEQITRADIELYVSSEMMKNGHYKRIAAAEPDKAPTLLAEIVEKASGVFLWVFLVTRSLQEGLANADRILDLQLRLQQLPNELEELFTAMLKGQNSSYFAQAVRLFRLVLEAETPLSLLKLSYCDEEDPDYVCKMQVQPLTRDQIIARCDGMNRRLKSRTQGLLEARPRRTDLLGTGHDVDILTPDVLTDDVDMEVQFLHRTVKDFLETPSVQMDFVAEGDGSFDPHLTLLRAFVGCIKSSGFHGRSNATIRRFWSFIDPAISHAKKIEQKTHTSPITWLHELDDAASDVYANAILKHAHSSSHWSNSREKFCGDPPWTSLLTYAVEVGLDRYVAFRIESKNCIVSFGPPLLHFAFCDPTGGFDVRRESFISPNPEMIQLLLEHGADPNQYFSGWTVWERLLFSLRLGNHFINEEGWISAVRIFVRHGADCNIKLCSRRLDAKVCNDEDHSDHDISAVEIVNKAFHSNNPHLCTEVEKMMEERIGAALNDGRRPEKIDILLHPDAVEQQDINQNIVSAGRLKQKSPSASVKLNKKREGLKDLLRRWKEGINYARS